MSLGRPRSGVPPFFHLFLFVVRQFLRNWLYRLLDLQDLSRARRGCRADDRDVFVILLHLLHCPKYTPPLIFLRLLTLRLLLDFLVFLFKDFLVFLFKDFLVFLFKVFLVFLFKVLLEFLRFLVDNFLDLEYIVL